MFGPEFADWQAIVHGGTVDGFQMCREMNSSSWAHPKSLCPPSSSSRQSIPLLFPFPFHPIPEGLQMHV